MFSSMQGDLKKDWWNSYHGLLGSGINIKTIYDTMLRLH
jgi:hypothetical protein